MKIERSPFTLPWSHICVRELIGYFVLRCLGNDNLSWTLDTQPGKALDLPRSVERKLTCRVERICVCLGKVYEYVFKVCQLVV